MTIGVGGKTPQQALDSLQDMTKDVQPIAKEEYLSRIKKAQSYMKEHNIAALYLNAGTNLKYFTGLAWYASERMVGAILPVEGDVEYIAPEFEVGSLKSGLVVEGHFNTWLEHESPYKLFTEILKNKEIAGNAKVGIDESAQFFIADGIRQAQPGLKLINGSQVTAHCRMHKSAKEIELIQRAMDMTLAVHKATASMLHEGISTIEVEAFIQKAHQKVGASGNYFCIVLFGVASSFPHGVKDPQYLKKGDVVLIDTGCSVQGYISDITRTYVYGQANERQREFWNYEKEAQLKAFEAAKLGDTCGDVDEAARSYLASKNLGPDYQLPGLPHRTGHGIGLDIHEWPYLVKGNPHKLAQGMCFSNEPMLVVPDEFGIRLEDHFYMTEKGPKWFTQPSHSIDDPFALDV
jgi:Xaa-Pro dipeptidase